MLLPFTAYIIIDRNVLYYYCDILAILQMYIQAEHVCNLCVHSGIWCLCMLATYILYYLYVCKYNTYINLYTEQVWLCTWFGCRPVRGNTHCNHKSKWSTLQSQLFCCMCGAFCQGLQVANTVAHCPPRVVSHVCSDALSKAMLLLPLQVQWSSLRPTQLPLMCVELATSPSGVSMMEWRMCQLCCGSLGMRQGQPTHPCSQDTLPSLVPPPTRR